jgi:hypothetical protein
MLSSHPLDEKQPKRECMHVLLKHFACLLGMRPANAITTQGFGTRRRRDSPLVQLRRRTHAMWRRRPKIIDGSQIQVPI